MKLKIQFLHGVLVQGQANRKSIYYSTCCVRESSVSCGFIWQVQFLPTQQAQPSRQLLESTTALFFFFFFLVSRERAKALYGRGGARAPPPVTCRPRALISPTHQLPPNTPCCSFGVWAQTTQGREAPVLPQICYPTFGRVEAWSTGARQRPCFWWWCSVAAADPWMGTPNRNRKKRKRYRLRPDRRYRGLGCCPAPTLSGTSTYRCRILVWYD